MTLVERGRVQRWFLRHPWILLMSGVLLAVLIVATEVLSWLPLLWKP